MKIKKRFDQRVGELLPQYSRKQIQGWIMRGNVRVDGVVITKPGVPLGPDAQITHTIEDPKFVSRAGFKLEHALDQFCIDVAGLTVLDAGLSTGGFTDCLLQRGAKKIFGVDVGYGQVHEKIRTDERVVLFERTNLRHLTLEKLGQQVDLVTLDLSFISLLKVIEPVLHILKADGHLVTLIKPQFEAKKHEVGRGGIVREASVHESVIERIKTGIEKHGFVCQGIIESPIEGGSGNKEFLAHFVRN